MIFPINKSKYKIIKQIYESKRIKISDLLRKTNVSQKSGYKYLKELLNSEIISEEIEGKKPVLRILKPNYSESGKLCFALIELQKRADFFKNHPELKGPFVQFENEIKDIADCALIFGSFARGSETRESDIDITILGKKKIKKKIEKISDRCFVTLKNRTSIRILDTKEFIKSKDEMNLQIMKDHVLIANAEKWMKIVIKKG